MCVGGGGDCNNSPAGTIFQRCSSWNYFETSTHTFQMHCLKSSLWEHKDITVQQCHRPLKVPSRSKTGPWVPTRSNCISKRRSLKDCPLIVWAATSLKASRGVVYFLLLLQNSFEVLLYCSCGFKERLS